MSVKALFDAGATHYDENRRKVIFCFDSFYATLLDLVPFDKEERFSFLDLGAGTGLVSSLILERFPRAEGSLLDISENMLEKARLRFSGNGRITFYVRDYEKQPLPGGYPLVVSAMSIHHLSDLAKRLLVRKIFDTLAPGGMFIHAELTLGATEKTEAVYQQHWRKHLESTDIGTAEMSAIYRRMAADRPAPLERQLGWMHAAGFVDVDCFFKHYNFSVYAGTKPAAE